MSNVKSHIENLSLIELKDLLKEVKLYRDLKKQLWKRWETLYSNIQTWAKTYVVEYFPSLTEELAWDESKKVFKKVFELDVKKEDVSFIEAEKIKGWMKVYVDDKVVDLSYQKIEKMVTA